MSLLKRNIIANLIGNGWSAVLSIIVIPVYIHFMGIESFALIGIHITLMTISLVMDMGMSTTINREMARLTSLPDKAQEAINLVSTMEIFNWIIAIFIGSLILSLAHPIAHYWIKPGRLTAETVQQAIYLMGFSMVFQWPFTFYSGGLAGLQKQVLLNGITASMATLRSVGAILILWLISPTIQAFLVWQIIVNALQFCTLATFFKKNLPQTGKRAVFQLSLISGIWRFAAGMGGISIISMIMSQMDKFILSKLLSLETFGYYTLASVVATSFSRLMGPLVTAIFPRFTHLVTIKDVAELKQMYHKGCQLMSALIIPMALFLSFFSWEILFLWTRNSVTTNNAYFLVFFLSLATMFNGLAHLPISLEYAHGRTRQVFCIAASMTIIMIPAMILATVRFGAIGATTILMIIYFIYTLLIVQFVHRDILPQEKRDWYVRDVGLPLVVSLAVVGTGRLLLLGNETGLILILELAAVAFSTFGATFLTLPVTRNWLLSRISKLPKGLFHAI